MKSRLLLFCSVLFLLFPGISFGQNVALYDQFFGRYDFTFFGNTLNPNENTQYFPDHILTSSSADLSLSSGSVIEKAYLYWAGCGPGDFNIKLNNIDISAQRTFSTFQASAGPEKIFFAAFYDITNIVTSQGNTTYTVSELDVNDQISDYWDNATHFAGWAVLVVYKNNSLPLNVVNVYDGLESLSTTPLGEVGELTITIDNLNVIDDVGSKIGFIAWEGDRGIPAPGTNIIESLSINGITVGNPPLNPPNNAFNGTNSVTGAENLYNMDLDIYNIQNFINIGDDSATIQLATGQDYVMINTIVTKLNSQLPDATVTIEQAEGECNSRNITVNYTVSNFNATDFLPAGTPISIYANGTLIGTNQTPNDIQIGDSEYFYQTVTVPNGIPLNFTLEIIVDQPGVVTELVENNNNNTMEVILAAGPTPNPLPDLISCNRGRTEGLFDFSAYENLVTSDPNSTVTFHESQLEANAGINPIADPSNYLATSTPKTIYVRIDGPECFTTTSFLLTVKPCPPIVYNAVSVNGDGMNDTFHIEGLYDVFVNFELTVYNRWGREVWKGNNNTPEWNGYIKDGVGGNQAPDGTYFYILYLNDKDYPKPLNGYLYLNH
ncbi:MAG TPA: gliding motility-associated C-terminal domain-containing protein [Flavobacterium sp.]|uniref:T9SS type B sorting domain-containing protein n=1 Tax=Flavobacterium sp. TaxID=239 RepID=UPI002BD1A856|nr:gliding motility-associated C-terminal domain-containing protein [Flavobacterium sp.]HSD14556.1 gliding motility-associated C-terminal domain-containing protein [Flavobacterium sp.]